MIEISVNKISKSYGFSPVLKDFSFEVKTNERIALIGPNGCGKTTTLRMIKKEETPDSGSINVRSGSKIGYLNQIPNKEQDGISANDVYLRGIKELLALKEELDNHSQIMSSSSKDIIKYTKLREEFEIKGGYQLNEKICRIKNGFKLTDTMLNTEYNKLSGGEKTIVNLASIILSNPDVLLLDEPTNHLDIDTLEWFEEYLKTYKGSILLISHDRSFLDEVVTKVISINNYKEDVYYGNYSYYLKESEKRMLLEFQSYKNQQKQIEAMESSIARLKEWGIKSDNPIFFRRAASIQKRLDKMVIIEKPAETKELPVGFNITERTGNEVLRIKNLCLFIDKKELLSSSNMNINYQDRVCLMGKNGSGKTTLINAIMNNNSDSIVIGSNVKIGFIPQEIRFENDEDTIYEYVRRIYIGDESSLRSKLHQFYFVTETLGKKIKYLSGGEKVRIKLFELILKGANFLILDEPTNHIDIDTKEILEEALLNYKGTILFISHDRYFINKIATSIVRIENKKLITYKGNYDSIKTKVVVIEETPINKPINIDGSNRVKEYIKETKIEEILPTKTVKVYKIKKKSKITYLKIADHLSQESIRLEYLEDKNIAPKKIFYEKYNGKSYLMTGSLEGKNLSDDIYINNPKKGIDILVSAYNAIYSIDYSDCVIDETIDNKIKLIEDNIKKIDIANINRDLIKKFINVEGIIKYLKGNKPSQIIGFTIGNASLENIMAKSETFIGFSDVSKCGISDIYIDIVSSELSIEKNYGPEYVDLFYNELGIEKDINKTKYYTILLELYNCVI